MRNSKDKKTKTTREIVLDIFLEHRDWNAAQIYGEYKVRRGKDFVVTLNAVQKHVETFREEYKYIGHLDAPWHLGLLINPQYNMTPEAVRVIVDIERKLEKDKDKEKNTFRRPNEFESIRPTIPELTIREALWISRLYKLFDHAEKVLDEEGEEYIKEVNELIYERACAYAEREIICKLNKIYFDTFALDQALRLGNFVFAQPNRHTIEFYERSGGVYAEDTADPETKKFNDIRRIKFGKPIDLSELEKEINKDKKDDKENDGKNTKQRVKGKSKNS
jgi:hypothetical protein